MISIPVSVFNFCVFLSGIFTQFVFWTDTGIEITIPLDYYNNKDYIEVLNMPDGRLAIQIKNIGNIENK